MEIFKLLLEKDLPFAIILVVSLCVIIFETIVLAKIFLPLWFPKNEKKNSKNDNRPDKVCGPSLQARHEKRLENIEKLLNGFNEKLQDIGSSVKELADRTEDVSRGTLENMLFNDDYPSMFNRLKALRRLIAMNVNGRVCDKGYDLILKDKERWKDVYSMKMNLNIVDRDYYKEMMNKYNKLVMQNREE